VKGLDIDNFDEEGGILGEDEASVSGLENAEAEGMEFRDHDDERVEGEEPEYE
jgi:hypothetical protein